MKKIIFIKRLVLVLILVQFLYASDTAQGRRVLNNPENKAYWGLHASYNKISCINVSILDLKYDTGEYFDFFDRGKGFSIGGIFHLPIVANFYFEPGFSFNYGRFNIRRDAFIGSNKELLENGGVLKQNDITFTGVKVPLLLGYHFDFSRDFNFSVFMGPVMNIAFSMKAKIKIDTGSSIHTTEASLFKPYQSKEDDYLKRLYGQWRTGASIGYRQFEIGVSFDGELSNMLRVSDYNKQFYSGHFNFFQSWYAR